MNFLRYLTLAICTLGGLSTSAYALSPEARACLELAASPADTLLPEGVTGVPFGQIDTEPAIRACEIASDLAFKAGTDVSILTYTLGRAYHAAQEYNLAKAAYDISATSNNPLALNNLGSLYYTGNGVEQNLPRAYELFSTAGELGLFLARRTAAGMIEDGEVGEPNWELAADHWRALSQNDEAEYSFKLATRIASGDVKPVSETELTSSFERAANAGHLQAARDYSKWLESTDSEAALRYAYVAYDIAAQADISSENGWLIYEQEAAKRVVGLVESAGFSARNADELTMFRRDFVPETMKSYNVPIKCGDDNDVQFKFYVWDWSRDFPQSTEQAEWIEKARGCEFPDDAAASFEKLFKIARENNISFVALTEYSFSNEEKLTQEPEYKQHVDHVLGEKVDTNFVTSFTVSLNCEGSVFTRTFAVYFGSGFIADENFGSLIGTSSLRYTPCESAPEKAKWEGNVLNRIIGYNARVNEENYPLYTTLKLFNTVDADDSNSLSLLFVAECLEGIGRYYSNPSNKFEVDFAMKTHGLDNLQEVVSFYQKDFIQIEGKYSSGISKFREYARRPIELAALRRLILNGSFSVKECADGSDRLIAKAVFSSSYLTLNDSLQKLIEGQLTEARTTEGHWTARDFGFYSLTLTGNDTAVLMVLCNEMGYSGERVVALVEDTNAGPSALEIDGVSYGLNVRSPTYVLNDERKLFPVKADDTDDLLTALKGASRIQIEFSDGNKVPLSARGSSKAISWVMSRCDV